MQESAKYGQEDEYIAENREDVMMALMELENILDIQEVDIDGVEGIEIYTEYSNLAKVRDEISKLGYVIVEAQIIKEAKMSKKVSEKDLEKAQDALERLEDHDDVQNVWSDLE